VVLFSVESLFLRCAYSNSFHQVHYGVYQIGEV
jgi:hypothetical protein